MGVVLRARHVVTHAEVALKVLHSVRISEDAAARLLVEARAPAAIGHPGVVTVTDAGCTADGTPYLVMELLRGEALGALLARGRLPWARAKRILLEVLDIL